MSNDSPSKSPIGFGFVRFSGLTFFEKEKSIFIGRKPLVGNQVMKMFAYI